jgi:hypothetical protein
MSSAISDQVAFKHCFVDNGGIFSDRGRSSEWSGAARRRNRIWRR